jgi:hypothetical protein
MTQAGYHTAFEIGFGTFPWARILHPLIFVTIGLLLVLFFRQKQIYFVMGIIGIALGALFLLTLLFTFVPRFFDLRNDYMSGRTSVVEGVVKEFRAAPSIGPARESFSVQGMRFSYNALEDTPCFHNAPIHAGPLREGLDVRIHYNDLCIQRVDILEQGSPSN